MPNPVGHPRGKPLGKSHRDDVTATQLLNVLKKHAISKKSKMGATRIAAARVALPFLIPSLSAVDQTLHSPDDELSEDQLIVKFQALIAANPDLLQRLLAVVAKSRPGVSEVQAPVDPSYPQDDPVILPKKEAV